MSCRDGYTSRNIGQFHMTPLEPRTRTKTAAFERHCKGTGYATGIQTSPNACVNTRVLDTHAFMFWLAHASPIGRWMNHKCIQAKDHLWILCTLPQACSPAGSTPTEKRLSCCNPCSAELSLPRAAAA
mmetsp:Transcript_3918/g.7918  ORF Transcript_3918/g.7918 Transcript_3918/m.7918 type:complete len:128 (-) Transcript_3918:424-807(-)